ncbi:MAG: outer membrane lipoprotein carrier protein LolA [Desulforhopalus sp.]
MIRQHSMYIYIIHFIATMVVASMLIGIFPPFAYSNQSTDLTRFLQEIQLASDKVRSFSSPFIQERHLALFASPVIFHGQLIVVRPDRLRWEFTSPVPSVLIFRGDSGTRCNDEAPPVQFDLNSDPVMRTVAEQLWLWLGGDYLKLNDLYHIEKKGNSSLVIIPKDESVSEFIWAVTITFSDGSRQPEEVEILEPGGDSTLISFQSYTLNSDIPEILFSHCGTND